MWTGSKKGDIKSIFMDYLITGGSGFIGTNLIELLLEKGHKVRVLDNMLYGQQKDFGDLVSAHVGAVEDFDVMSKVMSNIDIVVHLAANTGVLPSIENPLNDFISNSAGTIITLSCALRAKVNRFVFASSGAVLGEIKPPAHEGLMCSPMSPYAASKLTGEAYCSAFYHSYNLSTTALRFSNVYGPYSKHKNSLVHKFITHVLASDEPFQIYGDGKQTRDFIYVGDLVEAVYAASIKEAASGQIFQIATQKETSIIDILSLMKDKLEDKLNKKIIIEHVPEKAGEVRKNYACIDKAKDLLQFNPSTSINEGIDKTIDWYIEGRK